MRPVASGLDNNTIITRSLLPLRPKDRKNALPNIHRYSLQRPQHRYPLRKGPSALFQPSGLLLAAPLVLLRALYQPTYLLLAAPVFRTVRGPGGAPRGDSQEPRTGWDGTGRLSVVRPGRPKGRAAGPTGCDMLVQGRGVDGR